MVRRLQDAMNAHDAGRMSALFAQDYRSDQPVHPGRHFTGSAQVLMNWSAVFEGVPDFGCELIASCVQDGTEWGEWGWEGHHADGSPFAMRGVTVFLVRDDHIAEGRLYMEPVEADGHDITAAVRDLSRPPVR
ncbi:nuclear transport factor 2 family protein [Nocardioides sp. P5_C9_2]